MKPFRSVYAIFFLLAVFQASLFAQETPAKLEFEVAAIKLSPPLSSIAAQAASGKIDLGIRIDASQFHMKFMSLTNLMAMAYKVKAYQIEGPDWMKTTLWEIHAKLPEGSNKDQINEMVQSLLAERFKLTFHRETRDQSVYALTVAKSGLKIKEVVDDPAAPADPTSPNTPEGEINIAMKPESNGVSMDMGKIGKMQMIMTGDSPSMRWELPKVTIADFAEILTQFTDRQVVDMTELKGNYTVMLELPLQEVLNMAKRMMPEIAGNLGGNAAPGSAAPSSGLDSMGASDPTGGSIFQSVKQLGLSLDARKVPTETFVIDSVDKEPTEN